MNPTLGQNFVRVSSKLQYQTVAQSRSKLQDQMVAQKWFRFHQPISEPVRNFLRTHVSSPLCLPGRRECNLLTALYSHQLLDLLCAKSYINCYSLPPKNGLITKHLFIIPTGKTLIFSWYNQNSSAMESLPSQSREAVRVERQRYFLPFNLY